MVNVSKRVSQFINTTKMNNPPDVPQAASRDYTIPPTRNEKRRQQRKALSSAFEDPLEKFIVSPEPALRQISQELADDGENLVKRIRQVSTSSQELIESFNPEAAQRFVAERESLTEDLADHLKACRTKLREARDTGIVDKKSAKRMLSGIEDLDATLLKERAALARNRIKLEYGILSHPTHARIGEAYLAAVVQNLPEPAGARLKRHGARDGNDQQQFKILVREAYTPAKGSSQYNPPFEEPAHLWCPVTRAWHDVMNTTIAHIVPYGIGEFNAAYIFGVPVEDGWRTIWDYRNGLVLHSRIEQALDAGQLVLVPNGESGDGLKVVILDDSILDKYPYAGGPKYKELNNSILEFKTKARPLKRYLYFLCLITLYRRHRYFVEGSERDQEKIQMRRIWGTPGKWMRGSIIRALAMEVGDMLKVEDDGEDEAGVESMSPRVSPEKERKIAVEIRDAVEGMYVDDGEADDDEI